MSGIAVPNQGPLRPSDGAVALARLADGRMLTIDGGGGYVTALVWNDHGTRLGWGGEDGRVGILDMEAESAATRACRAPASMSVGSTGAPAGASPAAARSRVPRVEEGAAPRLLAISKVLPARLARLSERNVRRIGEPA